MSESLKHSVVLAVVRAVLVVVPALIFTVLLMLLVIRNRRPCHPGNKKQQQTRSNIPKKMSSCYPQNNISSSLSVLQSPTKYDTCSGSARTTIMISLSSATGFAYRDEIILFLQIVIQVRLVLRQLGLSN